jgi:plastocyanin
MTAVDKAAIAWTIAIVVVGVAIASMGEQTLSPSTPAPTATPIMEKESAATMQPKMTKATIPGWDRAESIQDPGIGHETHQLAVLLAPSDKIYSGTLQYDASEPIQLVSLKGPIGPKDSTDGPIWTPDGKTQFALTLVDNKNAKGTWKFEGNALAVHTFKTTPFIIDYKLDYTISESMKKEEKPMEKTMMEKPTGPKTVKVSMPSGTSVPGCEATNKCFVPASVSIKVGDTVVWSNDDSAAHTVTSGSPAEGPSGVFDSSLLIAGGNYEHTFDSTGTVNYFCMVHPWMVGNVKVS